MSEYKNDVNDVYHILQDIKELLYDIKDILKDIGELPKISSPITPVSGEELGKAIGTMIPRRIRTVSEAASLLERKSFQDHQPITAEDVRAFAKGNK